jgi:putative spermidine/putrescine transport system ATP-binding protein
VSEPREAGAEIRKVGATVYLKPASPAACHVFPSP